MKYAPYQNYKPGNSDWLLNIPGAWQQIRGRFVMGVNPTPVCLRDLEDADEVSFVPMEAVGENGGLNLDRTKPLEEVGSGYTEFENGDVVIAKITPCFENGKSAIASGLKNGVAFGTTELHVLRAGKRLDMRFLFYLTTSHTFRMLGESEMYGAGGQKRVPPEFAKDFRVPLPPIEEQQTIARFLDAKTAQIDALVAQKRQLIDKLKEKRSALIARTVTRGLPPEAAKAAGLEPHPEMKNSGVDWLGEVPERWKVLPLRRLIKFVKTGNTPSGAEDHHFEENGFNWYSPSDFSDDIYLGLANRALSAEGKTEVRIFPEKTVMLVGIGATIGKVGIALGECSCNQQINAIGCNSKLDPVFATYYLKILRDFIVKCGKFTTLPIINQDETKNLVFTVPPLSEQSAIAIYLDRETIEIDRLMVQVDEAISRLTEYRQALITSAVTGKIDVRAVASLETEMA